MGRSDSTCMHLPLLAWRAGARVVVPVLHCMRGSMRIRPASQRKSVMRTQQSSPDIYNTRHAQSSAPTLFTGSLHTAQPTPAYQHLPSRMLTSCHHMSRCSSWEHVSLLSRLLTSLHRLQTLESTGQPCLHLHHSLSATFHTTSWSASSSAPALDWQRGEGQAASSLWATLWATLQTAAAPWQPPRPLPLPPQSSWSPPLHQSWQGGSKGREGLWQP